MRPSLAEIAQLRASSHWESDDHADRLERIRLNRPTRYAKRSQYSQRQRRRDARRVIAHGWTR